MSKGEQVQRTGNSLFWKGLITGLATAATALALTAGLVSRRGVTVTVPTSAISQRMQAEVRQAVRRELPAALAAMRAEMPRQVAAEAGRRLAGARIDLGGFELPVPPAAVEQVQQVLDQAVRIGLDNAVSRVDVDGLADRLGGQAARLTDDRLREFLAQQAIAVEVAPGLRVPVRLIPR